MSLINKHKCRQPKGAYLQHRAIMRVRFQEVDSLEIAWHGHYLSYFEDARVAFGRRYGLSYSDIRKASLITPIVHVSCDYLKPAFHDDELQAIVRLIRTPGAKLEFYYEVSRTRDDTLLACGRTTQAFMDAEQNLLMTIPPFLAAFYKHWESEMVPCDE